MSGRVTRATPPRTAPVRRSAVVIPVPREARPYQGRRAGVVSRLLAGAVDLVLLVVMVLGALGGWAALLFLWRPSQFEFPGYSRPALVAVGTGLLVLYLAVAWSTSGRSYGDHVLGLRVVDARHRHLGPGRALVRAVLYVVFPLGLLWCGVSRSRQSLQDLVLRTAVIYDWVEHPRAP